MHKYLNTTHRSVIWFKKAFDANELVISPPFQRNPVWSRRQQAALIVTILLEYPIPELYMQDITDETGAQRHTLVDGQQRIRSILEFLDGQFELDDESDRWGGLSFEDLSPEDRKRIFEYAFVVRLLPDVPEVELRQIFQRINRNTTVLNAQELRHATYWGPFIKLMDAISDYEFWSDSGIFSASDRRRMLDVEFISELAVAVLNGLQNKKKNLEEFYQQYETSFEDEEHLRDLFVTTLGEIRHILPDLSSLRWKKKSDFYTLFLVFAENATSLPLSAEKRAAARQKLVSFALLVDEAIKAAGDNAIPVQQDVRDYLRNVERAASDLGSRRERATTVNQVLTGVF
jgi:hypothetical protein